MSHRWHRPHGCRARLHFTTRVGAGFGQGRTKNGRRGEAGCSSLKNLNAMVAGVSYDDAAVAVDGDAAEGAAELPVA